MKKAFSLLIVFVLLINIFIFFPQKSIAVSKDDITLYPYDLYPGDADNNGEINISDAQEIQLYVAQMPTDKPEDISDDWYRDILDTDQSGYVSVFDTTKLQRVIAGIDNESYLRTPLYTWQERIYHVTEKLNYENTVCFNALHSSVSSYLSDPNAVVTDYCNGSNLDKPLSYTLNVPLGAERIYIIDCTSKSVRVDTITSKEYSVNNLIPKRNYRYFFTNPSGKVLKHGQCRTNNIVRLIDGGTTTFNIRDIGGWECDNGSLKYGLIYRGCELNGNTYSVVLSEEQKQMFIEDLGIRDEIDLRSDAETSGKDNIIGTDDDVTTPALGDKTDYVRYSIAPYSVGVNLKNMYQTEYYSKLLKRIAADVSNEKPCYIHCLVGADRTATVCALVELICGVSQADVERDYELTSFARNNTRIRTGGEWQEFIKDLNKMSGSSLRDKAIDYALKAGVTKNEINALRKAMIDGIPEIIK